jgi:hypothetical protein
MKLFKFIYGCCSRQEIDNSMTMHRRRMTICTGLLSLLAWLLQTAINQ